MTDYDRSRDIDAEGQRATMVGKSPAQTASLYEAQKQIAAQATRIKVLEALLYSIRKEAGKQKPNPDVIHTLAGSLLSKDAA